MIHFFQTQDGCVRQIAAPVPGCWISVVDPTAQEIQQLIEHYGLDSGFVRSSLDEEESSRIEREDDQTLIIVDTAMSEILSEETILFFTVPLGIIITDDYVFTISLRDNKVLRDIADGVVKGIQTRMKTRFVMQLLLRITAIYLQDLKQIDKTSYVMEQKLGDAMKNQELIQMLELEKSLVYFSTSLKANEVTIEKLLRGRTIKLYDEDQDLLEDVLIEVRQAIEMSNIYSGIISSMVEAFGSVISNNLNFVMWRLTVVTIIMSIPTMIFSFYGMNTTGLPVPQTWFPTVVSILSTVVVAWVMLKQNKNKHSKHKRR
ncbi:MAG: magnesium transporter CorA family protein [Oscillospiraceae bacterium]|nr:magnesium transporter CorA family protein [Oscillospiraceae bacterium]